MLSSEGRTMIVTEWKGYKKSLTYMALPVCSGGSIQTEQIQRQTNKYEQKKEFFRYQ